MASDDEQIAVGSKRPGTRQTRSSNKRRQIVDDDDDDDDDDHGDEDEVGSQDAPANPSSDDAVKSRLLDRLKKTGDRTRESKLREEQRSQQKDADAKAKAAAAVAAIPKKSAVPRRSEKETSASFGSLLSGMAVPPPCPMTGKSSAEAVSSNAAPATTASRKPSKSTSSGPPSPRVSGQNGSTNQGLTEINSSVSRRAPPPSTSSAPVDLSANRTPPPAQPDNSSGAAVDVKSKANPRPPNAADESKKNLLQDRVWESLTELCRKMDALENRPFRLGPGSAGPTVDLSASFLRHEREYDWFDLDEHGGIVVQPKIPIFPEDFPQGKQEWPLSWWGIVDPALGGRKDSKIVTATGNEVVVPPSLQDDRRERSRSRDRRNRTTRNHLPDDDYRRSRSRDRHHDRDYYGGSRRGHRSSLEGGSKSNSVEMGSDFTSSRARPPPPPPSDYGPDGRRPEGMGPYGPPQLSDDRRRMDVRRSPRDRPRIPEDRPRGDRSRHLEEERVGQGGPPPPFRGDDRGRPGGGNGRYLADDRRGPRRSDEPRRGDRGGRGRGARHPDHRRRPVEP